ncbi:MAG TPA: MaoC/PaaZ C-terminal domain-containing protein, partial [Burkholderiaceae bacterium]|nr:MaoC/PaaZ C-terminal domain-containing protein [Burkholderiaceae bacterium]
MATVISSATQLAGLVGQELGVTDWLEVTQERVNQFADATGDHQWIHVDPARAAGGPFGGCVAHGYLSLALAGSYFLERIV